MRKVVQGSSSSSNSHSIASSRRTEVHSSMFLLRQAILQRLQSSTAYQARSYQSKFNNFVPFTILNFRSSQEPTFKCPECDKMFSRKANLESHVNHVHTVERNFECEICGLRVKTKGILRMHKKIHTTNAEDLLPCDMCQKQFKTQNQLTNHKISHSNEKRHKCILCSAQYKRSKELASHVASSHTGESKYTCRWCSKTFYNNSNFRKHKVKMHFEELESPEKKLVDDRDSTFNYE